MAGMPSKTGYGRLADEDEEEAMFRAWDAAEDERKREREKEARTRRMVVEALGAPRKAESVLGLEASDFHAPQPPPVFAPPGVFDTSSPPEAKQLRSNNPFAAPYRHDDRPDELGTRDHCERRPAALARMRDTWAWEGRSGEPSPTTSSGSRSSGSSGERGGSQPTNPFR